MRLCGMDNIERVYMHPNDDPHVTHYIEIAINDDRPTFDVTYCCDDKWIWEFVYTKTNYEMVKHIVMDCMFECDSMEELIEELDEVFETEFMDMVCEGIDADEFEDEYEVDQCDGDCEHCNMIFE